MGMDQTELTRRVRGPILTPAHSEYDTERSGFQTAAPHRPELIVGATCPEDVVAAVEGAAGQGLLVAVQTTGHGQAAAAQDGVLVTMGRMTGVHVDPAARTARMEAGVRWERVIQEAARHGLAPLNGSSPDVGAVGYTLAGGIGVLGRRYGFAADHVRSLEVVTADGCQRRVTAESEPDLFWALRGGLGNFGVVTAMEIELVPVTRLYGGGLYFDTDRVADVLRTWREWTAGGVPDEMTSSVGLIPFPDMPAVPEPLRGRYAAHVRIAYQGGAADGERLVAPLRSAGPRLMDTLGEMPYTACGTIYNDPAHPHAYRGTGVMLRGLDASVLDAVVDLAGPSAAVPCIVQLNHLGGALARPPAIPNAVGHRDARYLLRVLSPLAVAGEAAVRATHQRLLDRLSPLSLGRCPSFLFGPQAPEEVRSAYDPDDYRRLQELKARYDPANLFRVNHNIPPSMDRVAGRI